MDQSAFFIEPLTLRRQMAGSVWPVIIDVCLDEDRETHGRALPGSRLAIATDLIADPSACLDRPALIVCHRGKKISQAVVAAIRAQGGQASVLEGGIVRWMDEGLPTVALAAIRQFTGPARRPWVTRRRPKIDRVACPWLISRYLDPDAVFWFVGDDQVSAVVERTGAIPYDIAGVAFTHVGELCSFDALIAAFDIRGDAALDHLALTVRGADTHAFDLSPESAGLLGLSLGFSARAGDDDRSMLRQLFPVYDALYAHALLASGETHTWNPQAGTKSP